jgi:hypothetical protein
VKQKEITALAVSIEQSLADEDFDGTYVFGKADGVPNPTLMCEADDVYEMLKDPMTRFTLDLFGHAVVVAHGWARNMTDWNEPPHRVRLLVAVSREGARASVVRFIDTGETLVDDVGEANGELADAITALVAEG